MKLTGINTSQNPFTYRPFRAKTLHRSVIIGLDTRLKKHLKYLDSYSCYDALLDYFFVVFKINTYLCALIIKLDIK